MTMLADILPDSEQLARLRLARTEGVGPVLFRKLMLAHETAGDALLSIEQQSANFKKPLRAADAGNCLRELETLRNLGGTALFWGTRDYPSQLAAIDDAPPVLFVLGDPQLLHSRSVGIVGARNASASGLKIAGKIALDLGAAGVTVVSGLARGIDTAAHKASLNTGTIACVAGGIDIIYPPENKTLYRDIIERGAVVSEMPMGAEPQARHFPRRNRIISGLSHGILVIEAAQKSGSLITARFAADQGRDVFAVPGSPLDPRAQGTNQLIRDGAVLTQSAADILEDWSGLPLLPPRRAAATQQQSGPTQAQTQVQSPAPSAEGDILPLLSAEPVHIDDLVRLTGRPAESVMTALLEFEMAGKILRHTGGRISRVL